MEFFPFDTQNCTIQYKNSKEDTSVVLLESMSDTIQFDNFEEHYLYNISSTSVWLQSRTYNYIGTNMTFQSIFFQIELIRYPHYYLVTMIIPCIFL